jgi:hypothetical protein
MEFVFIVKHRGIWPVRLLCETLGVSRSGFYAWASRSPSARTRSDEQVRQRLGQRCHGELLLLNENRTHRTQGLSLKGPGTGRRIRIYRTVLQSAPAPLDDRLSQPYGIRTAGSFGLRSVSIRPAAAQLGTITIEHTRGSPRLKANSVRNNNSPSIMSVFARRLRRGTDMDAASTTWRSIAFAARTR